MSFNFGSNLGANTSQPGFGYGTPKTNTLTFGSLVSTPAQPSGSITFGTPIASVAPTQQNAGLSFGTPTLGTGTPASAAPNTALNFAAPVKTTGLAFGTPTSQPALGFGAPTANTQPGLNFGTPVATAQTGLNFGTPVATTQTGLNFGTPGATTQTGLNFGTPGATTQTGLNFGTPGATTQTGLNFGTPGATTQTGLNFGTPVATTQTGLNFGTTPTSNLGAAPVSSTWLSSGLSFAAPATSGGGGLNFGAPTSTPSTAFTLGGTPATTAPNPNPLGGINFGATTTTPNLSFAAPATSNPNPLGGISFATPASSSGFAVGAPAAASTGLSFGLGGTTTSTAGGLNFKAATTSTGINFGFNTPKPTTTLSLGTTAVTTPIGLGGVDSSQLKTGTVSTGRTDTVAGKESQVPNEILQSIESFKQFVKDQKTQSSDVSRGSARPFVKVKEDIDLINTVLTDVGNDLQRNQQQADKLKHDSAKCLHNAEMAQRTNDTPPGLQFENNAPLRYFIELVNQFEQDLQALRVQIDVTDKHFQSLHEPKFLTSQELATGMRRLHDTFVALAGRLHSVHTQVESHKEQYLNLRKYILKDPTNIFIKPASKEEQALDVALRGLTANKPVSGPTPFSSFGSPFGINMLQAQQNAVKPPPAYPSATTALSFGGGAPSLLGSTAPQIGANTSLFGNPTLGLGQTSADASFQLQNPPPGNKRGKR